jgi:hypothetical protein
MLLPAVVLFVAAGLFPSTPTITVLRARDFAGRPFPEVVIRSSGERLRIDAFGRVFRYDGRTWSSERPIADEDSGAVAFLALAEPGPTIERSDAEGRPAVVVGVPAGPKKARVEYRWDSAGLAAANLVFTDGSGFQFRRVSSEPAVFSPSDFEPPRVVVPLPANVGGAAGGAADTAAVARLFSLTITDAEQLAFEKAGGVGRYRPRTAR